jgi:hypothetical protein
VRRRERTEGGKRLWHTCLVPASVEHRAGTASAQEAGGGARKGRQAQREEGEAGRRKTAASAAVWSEVAAREERERARARGRARTRVCRRGSRCRCERRRKGAWALGAGRCWARSPVRQPTGRVGVGGSLGAGVPCWIAPLSSLRALRCGFGARADRYFVGGGGGGGSGDSGFSTCSICSS